MTNSQIGNNIIYTKQKGSEEAKASKETILFGPQQVDTGVQSGNKEIATNHYSGLKYERDEIVAKTVYNLRTQVRHKYLVIDLETGTRGWYPGCIRVADIVGENVAIKSEMSETSQTLFTVTNDKVEVLDLDYDSSKNIWYKIKYNSTEGFVRNTYISNVRYQDAE